MGRYGKEFCEFTGSNFVQLSLAPNTRATSFTKDRSRRSKNFLFATGENCCYGVTGFLGISDGFDTTEPGKSLATSKKSVSSTVLRTGRDLQYEIKEAGSKMVFFLIAVGCSGWRYQTSSILGSSV